MLKYFTLSFAGCLLMLSVQAQPMKYAGSMKGLVGKKYTDSGRIPGLTGWKAREGSIVTAQGDQEPIEVQVYQKGTTYIIFFSIQEDTGSREFQIADVIELKNVTKAQQVKTILCREYKADNPFIVALTGITPKGNYFKAIKAWRFNRDKIRFESIDAKTVDCLNEGDD